MGCGLNLSQSGSGRVAASSRMSDVRYAWRRRRHAGLRRSGGSHERGGRSRSGARLERRDERAGPAASNRDEATSGAPAEDSIPMRA